MNAALLAFHGYCDDGVCGALQSAIGGWGGGGWSVATGLGSGCGFYCAFEKIDDVRIDGRRKDECGKLTASGCARDGIDASGDRLRSGTGLQP